MCAWQIADTVNSGSLTVTVKVREGETNGQAIVPKIKGGLEVAQRALKTTIDTLAQAPRFVTLANNPPAWKRFQWAAWTFLKCDAHRNRKKSQDENTNLAKNPNSGLWNPFTFDELLKIEQRICCLRHYFTEGNMTIKIGFPSAGGRFCVWWLRTFQDDGILQGLVKGHLSTSHDETGPAKKSHFLGIPVVKGDIHLSDDIRNQDDSEIAHLLIHEACHKYLGCDDVNIVGSGYFNAGKGEFPRRLSRSESFNNADSIACFTMTVGDEFESKLALGGGQNGYESWGT